MIQLFKLIKDIFITILRIVFICVMLAIRVPILVTVFWPLHTLGVILFMTVMIIAGILPEKAGDRFLAFCDYISAPSLKIIKKIFGDSGSGHGSANRAFHIDTGGFN